MNPLSFYIQNIVIQATLVPIIREKKRRRRRRGREKEEREKEDSSKNVAIR